MPDIDPDQRTEPATPRRRQELRQRGQIPRSGDLTTAAMLLTATAALHFFGADLTIALADQLRSSLTELSGSDIGVISLARQLRELTENIARAAAPILAFLVVGAVAINLSQVGFVMTFEPVTPDPGRLDPLSGLRRIWSAQSSIAAATGVLKLLVLVAIAAGFFAGQLPHLVHFGDYDPAGLSRNLGASLVRLGFQLSIGLVLLAVGDYILQVWRFEHGIRMTKQELRDELRQTEGDPQTRQRRREAHQSLSGAG